MSIHTPPKHLHCQRLRGTPSSSTHFKAVPGHGAASPGTGKGTEARWVKVERPSLAMMYLSLSECACLQFFYIIVSFSSSLSVIPNNSRLRTTEGQGGHDLAFPCPEAGILSVKRSLQTPCSCPTSYSNHHS